jgi:hypothetical protein
MKWYLYQPNRILLCLWFYLMSMLLFFFLSCCDCEYLFFFFKKIVTICYATAVYVLFLIVWFYAKDVSYIALNKFFIFYFIFKLLITTFGLFYKNKNR